VWQKVDSPHQRATRLIASQDLQHRVVMGNALVREHAIDKPPGRMVAVHQLLPGHHSVCERNRPRVALKSAILQEARHKTKMDRSEVLHSVPYGIVCGHNCDFFLDRGHVKKIQDSYPNVPSG